MKNLESIIKKYSSIEYNKDNYYIGGGLDSSKFASNRHEDAVEDEGKLTFGKTCQMFKKAVGSEDIDFVKKVIKYAVPNMEWHHAGKLPKQYGGGMKKTYFLNSKEIVDLARNWNDNCKMYDLHIADLKIKEANRLNVEQRKLAFLKENATQIIRVEVKPEFFYQTAQEMNGKYGWFDSQYKYYNLTEYYSGWEFKCKETLESFLNIK